MSIFFLFLVRDFWSIVIVVTIWNIHIKHRSLKGWFRPQNVGSKPQKSTYLELFPCHLRHLAWSDPKRLKKRAMARWGIHSMPNMCSIYGAGIWKMCHVTHFDQVLFAWYTLFREKNGVSPWIRRNWQWYLLPLFLESTIVRFGKTYPPSLISTQRPRHNISSNIGFVLIQGLIPSFQKTWFQGCKEGRFAV
jgi:hypothetical protein